MADNMNWQSCEFGSGTSASEYADVGHLIDGALAKRSRIDEYR